MAGGSADGLSTSRMSQGSREMAALKPTKNEVMIFDRVKGKWRKYADVSNA